MTKVAVVAHARKTFGGGLGELRQVLAAEGVEPLWFEVPKSKYAPNALRRALKKGADLVLAWGGDGMQQRCIEVLAGTGVPLGILPAGTGNLLATNLDIPMNVPDAVAVALRGDRMTIDTGVCNGEHFAVMAGAGFDALMIKDADRGLKDRLGRAAYLWTGLRNISAAEVEARVKVDGEVRFEGQLSCVLVGNVSKVFASIEAFDGARPDDGMFEIGIVSASTPTQWVRAVTRVVVDRAENSPYVEVCRGRKVRVTLKHPLAYEIDGGDRPKTRKLRIDVKPASVAVRVPHRTIDLASAASSAHDDRRRAASFGCTVQPECEREEILHDRVVQVAGQPLDGRPVRRDDRHVSPPPLAGGPTRRRAAGCGGDRADRHDGLRAVVVECGSRRRGSRAARRDVGGLGRGAQGCGGRRGRTGGRRRDVEHRPR